MNTDKPNVIVRTELWCKIYNIIKQIPREKTEDDAMDAPSAATEIEFLLEDIILNKE